jgi:hypothetical protein
MNTTGKNIYRIVVLKDVDTDGKYPKINSKRREEICNGWDRGWIIDKDLLRYVEDNSTIHIVVAHYNHLNNEFYVSNAYDNKIDL